jgi:hypothetical protein
MMPFDDTHRPCERLCKGPCGLWKHYSRFRSRQRKTPHDIVWHFDPVCRDCQQKERNERKNADRPLAIIHGRAEQAARKAASTTEFFWTQMNYRALVPLMRVLMGSEGMCLACGHAFLNERDIHIDHIEPPRHEQDWARLHARNLRLACDACNKTKGKKPFIDWLDEQEGARLSNLESRVESLDAFQMPLFAGGNAVGTHPAARRRW